MPRGRSKSIVQKIANDVPNESRDGSRLPDLLKESNTHESIPVSPLEQPFKLTRAQSVVGKPNGVANEYLFECNPYLHITYPLTSTESHGVQSRYINTYDYDIILDPQHISVINDYQLDTVLNFQNIVRRNKAQVSEFVENADDILSDVESMLSKYNKISNDTLDFDKEANELLDLQTSYQQKYDQINAYLQHFEYLDFVTKNLSRSGTHLLNSRREFFIESILKKLDSSLAFVGDHPDFSQSELYASRFRQCMTRALSLVRNFLNKELKSIADSVNNKLHQDARDSKHVQLSIDLLLYHEYNNYLKENQEPFNELITQIQERTSGHPEYNGLLTDVLNKYFSDRLAFLRLYIEKTSTVEAVYSNTTQELVQVCQDQISYFEKITEKELNLFNRFFAPRGADEYMKNQLYQFLKRVLDPLYDVVRLLVLRELSISHLCQLTTLLQKYYEFDNQERDASLINANDPNGGSRVDYGLLFQPLLDEVQGRLVFRIQKYVDDRLIHFKPSVGDLKCGYEISGSAVESRKNDSLNAEYNENLFPDIYLPLGKSLTLLSNIYELINSVVFDDLAHYIVHACIELLRGEFLSLATAHMGSIDAKLLYLKNLLILRRQINTFDIQYTRSDYEIDFTSGLADIWQMIKSRNFTLNNNGLIDLASKAVPKIISNMIDANQEIEIELRNAVTSLINDCSNTICQPLVASDSQSGGALAAICKFRDNLISEIPSYYARVTLFLEDPVVSHFLMNNLANAIVAIYENYYNNLAGAIQTMDEETKEQFNEVTEVDSIYGYITEMITLLYNENKFDNKSKETLEFDEHILDELNLAEERPPAVDKSPSPRTQVES
ncbi:Conserved oligomeric Golgi complex subunit 3 [Candida viswanathii]|uniref:Conserved oligomeric Golgi complex subunit 3 n=1 Tax=Candida viswanathii TaxID=5486 RepID=A0A367YGG7_9ASCO|nr:Conserved oligomeric Golgi complex subunit 3 [Candida viswanathii]